jgi:hypothetical protein
VAALFVRVQGASECLKFGTGFATLGSSTAPGVPRTSACDAAHGAVAGGALIVLMYDLAFVKLRPRAEIPMIARFVRWHAL